MMKTKNKKQEDEGSTQSNASRYDPLYFTLPFLPNLVCLPLQAWLITCVAFATLLFKEVYQCHE